MEVGASQESCPEVIKLGLKHGDLAKGYEKGGKHQLALSEYNAAVHCLLKANEYKLEEEVFIDSQKRVMEYLKKIERLEGVLCSGVGESRKYEKDNEKNWFQKLLLMRAPSPPDDRDDKPEGFESTSEKSADGKSLSPFSKVINLFDRGTESAPDEETFEYFSSIFTTTGDEPLLAVYKGELQCSFVKDDKSEPIEGGPGRIFLSSLCVCFASDSLDKLDDSSASGVLKKFAISHILTVDKKRTGLWGWIVDIHTVEGVVYSFSHIDKAEEFHSLALELLRTCLVRNKFFGVSFEALLEREGTQNGIPKFLHDLVEFLDHNAFDTPGIFRLSPNHSHLNLLVSMINRGIPIYFEQEDKHALASLLKRFLRELPEPLIPYSMFLKYQELAGKNPSEEKRCEAIKQLLPVLPQSFRVLLSFLLKFLNRISKHSAVNKMTASNLVIVFCPILIQSSSSSPDQDMESLLNESAEQGAFLYTLLLHTYDLFPS